MTTSTGTTSSAIAVTVTPYLAVDGAARAIEFYRDAFGATEVMRMTDPAGKIGHAEILIGPVRIYLADEWPELRVLSPRTLGGCSVSFVLSVESADATVARAVAAGATVERPVADQFDDRRAGWIVDPFGHRWNVSSHGPDLPKEELQRRVGGEYVID